MIPRSIHDFGIYLKEKSLTGSGAEVGVASGGIGVEMLAWGFEHVYFVDAWMEMRSVPGDSGMPQEWHDRNMEEFLAKIEMHKERAIVLRGESSEMAATIKDGSLDFVYLDACHAYEFVVRDLLAWWPKIRSGGVLSGHDYLAPEYGVKQAADEFAAGRKISIGVLDAKEPSSASFWMEK